MEWTLNPGFIQILAYILGAYLLGSVPTGYIVARQLKGIDIREHGSRNVGATNVKRVVGNKAGLLVLILDFLKGLVPVLLAERLFPGQPIVPVATAVAAVVGHSRSIFLGFTGGKSAITGLGTIIALSPLGGLLLGLLAFTIIKITRFVSVGSMTTATVAPVLMYFLGVPMPYVLYGLASGLYVIYLHRANIGRLLQGTENRI